MKPVGEEQRGVISALNNRAAVDYLLQHPESFTHNAAQVEYIRVPHPVRDSISLVEWHVMWAYNHTHVLGENMLLLMEQAVASESLFQCLLQLQARLAVVKSLDDMLNRLHHWARELGLVDAMVRLFPDCWRLGAPSKSTHLALSRQVSELIRIQHPSQARRYFGPLNGPEPLVALSEAKAIGSIAMSMLGGDNAPGAMLFSSCDAQRYQSGQRTQLLQEIAQMLPGLLERWIEHA